MPPLPDRKLAITILFYAGVAGIVAVIVLAVLGHRIDGTWFAVFAGWCALPLTVTIDKRTGNGEPLEKRRRMSVKTPSERVAIHFATYPLTWLWVALVITVATVLLALEYA